ncbi:SCO2102 family sporulation regulator [Streptomyces sp. NPDC001781]
MGWTVLYIAFGVVALWLLGEVLLQYKARLRWRLLAFTGFLGVVVGVLMPSVVVIALGAIAFAVGQTYVTLSFRKGFAAGWAVKRPDDEEAGPVTRRRRNRAEHQDPVLGAPGPDESADFAQDHPGPEPAAYGTDGYDHDDAYDRDDVFTPARPDQTAAETTAVYEPQPMPDDTGSYGVYGDGTPARPQPEQTGQAYAYDYSGYDQQGYAHSGYDTGAQQTYPGYTDPYGHGYANGYDNSGYAQQGYAPQDYGQDAYGGQGETPAGGVWVPQQRTDENQHGELPPEQQYPYQGQTQQQNTGYDEQYRY